MKKFRYILVGLFLLNSCFGFGQSEKYSKVRIYINSESQIRDLVEQEILTDHFTKSAFNSIDAELSAGEFLLLTKSSVRYEVLIDDVKKHYLNNLKAFGNIEKSMPACGLQNFDYGTMGPYHKNSEVLAHLDSMKAKYPNLITAKDSIGTTIEGRTIYAVKISDNPDISESATEAAVYFDALHHAREPLAMEPLLYYMWWLLENYNTDPEATYLVNNREIYFVPVVNPDGYEFNEFTDPLGGGMWRKNRRNNGNGDYGVDLNRNYSSAFGNSIGSSGLPWSNTYRGDSAFSEPETRAIRDFLLQVNPSILFTCHSSGQKFLVSPGCMYPLEDYESYAEFSSEFINNSFAGYGTTSQMLGYTSCGTTRHFMHDRGIISWTPEIGSSFWAPQSEFCSAIQNFQGALKYISFVAGSYTRLNDFSVLNPNGVIANDTLEINVRVKNRGLTFAADSVSVYVKSLTPNCSAIDSIIYFNSINTRSFASGVFRFLVSPGTVLLDSIQLQITIKENDFVSYTGTKKVIAGNTNLIFFDDAETGISNWSTPTWDTTFIDMQSGFYSIADTRYGNYESSDNRAIELTPSVKLASATNPVLLFNAKWSLEVSFDDVMLEVSTNGSTWNNLRTYNGHSHWVQQEVNLSAYIGQTIYLRFRLVSDGSVQSDGFYFDDFKVVDFTTLTTSLTEDVNEDFVSVYPNPATDFVNINIGDNNEMDMELYNYLGSMIYSKKITNSLTNINFKNYSKGVYFIRLFNENQTVVRRIIKN
jgi:carboxypeptidase T